MIQLRNAGGYRLIRKGGAVDSIALYESKINTISIQQGFLSAGMSKAADAADLVFDFNAYKKFQANKGATPILITNDKDKISSFINQSWMMSIVLSNYTRMLEDHLQYSKRLIAYLEKTYDME
jgi:hypothetical protein